MKALYWSLYQAFGWAVLVTTLTATKSLAANPQHVSQFETTGQCANCDLAGASFVGIDFSDVKVNLQNANLNGANFSEAIMPKANLSGVSAVGSTFFGTDLQGANLKNTNLPYATLVKVKLNNAILDKTDLQGANLVEADLSDAKVTKTNFVGANIYKMKYSPALKDSLLGNTFTSDRQGSGLITGVTTTERITVDRTLESGTSVRRRYRIPAWINTPTRTTVGAVRDSGGEDQHPAQRRPIPTSIGQPSTTTTAGGREFDPDAIRPNGLE